MFVQCDRRQHTRRVATACHVAARLHGFQVRGYLHNLGPVLAASSVTNRKYLLSTSTPRLSSSIPSTNVLCDIICKEQYGQQRCIGD